MTRLVAEQAGAEQQETTLFGSNHEPKLVSGGPLQRWIDYLLASVDGASLAVFRICLAAVMVFHLLQHGKLISELTQPQFHFTYIPGLQALNGQFMVALFGVLAFLAVNMGLGLFYRASTVALCLGYCYLFLLDKALYSNYTYLLCLVLFLMCLAPANRVWSFDSAGANDVANVPRWSLSILKFQFLVVYFFSGLAKLNPDWLHGQAVGIWLITHARYPILSQLATQPWAGPAIAYGAIAIDFAICALVAFPRTFVLGATIVILSQLCNFRVLMGSSAPWLMIAAIGLFAPPALPRKVLKLIGFSQRDFVDSQGNQSKPVAKAPGDAANETAIFVSKTSTTRRPSYAAAIALVTLHVYALIQIVAPFRHLLYGGNTSWTEQGSHFSWTTPLYNKNVSEFEITVIDRKTGLKKDIDCTKILTQRQFSGMIATPDMILQFAHYLADREQVSTGSRPMVKVTAIASLNGSPKQNFIAPDVDLAAQATSVLPASWVVPLRAEHK
jgi:vitamin K-dependent gamma-carboxylase